MMRRNHALRGVARVAFAAMTAARVVRALAAWVIGAVVLFALTLVSSPVAMAQLGLPSVRLPTLPTVGLPGNLDKTAQGLAGDLDPQRLRDLRKLRVADLLRVH